MSKAKAVLDISRCKGCGYCVENCPQKALAFSGHISDKGYNTVQIDIDLCNGCSICYRLCPDYVFEIREN